MNLREAAKQALVALKYHVEMTRPINQTLEAITALNEALEKPDEIERLRRQLHMLSVKSKDDDDLIALLRNKSVDYTNSLIAVNELERQKQENANLRQRVAELEAGQGEPVAWLRKETKIVDGLWEDELILNFNGDGIPLYAYAKP